MTADEIEILKSAPEKTKFAAKRTKHNGHNYASKLEAKRAAELDVLIQTGHIKFWIAQPKFFLVKGFDYVADFLVAGYAIELRYALTVWAEDTKGVETQRFRDSKRLWAAHGTIPLHVKMMKSGRWNTTVITPEKLNE